MSYHQEERNLESVGKPVKLQPYTNVTPESKKPHGLSNGRSLSITGSASASGRGSRASSGASYYTKQLKLDGKRGSKGDGGYRKSKGAVQSLTKNLKNMKTAVSSIPDSETVITAPSSATQRVLASIGGASDSDKESDNPELGNDELDFSKLNNGLAYPQYDFDVEDDGGLFHDVGDINNLESLSLPTIMTKDKTPAEILQLLRKLERPGSPAQKYFRRSNSYSHSSKQVSRAVGRRLSLGSIPEGKVVTDYKEEMTDDNDLASQFFRDLENTIRGVNSPDVEGVEERGQSPSGCSSDEDVPVTTPCGSSKADIQEEHTSGTSAASKSPKTLKILNFSWDPTSNLVHTEVSSTPITSMERKPSLRVPTKRQPPTSIPALEVTPPTSLHVPSETPRKITPPSHRVTPLRKITPPPHEVMPPSYSEEVPDSSTHDISGCYPPPSDSTVPSRRITPPPRKITPPYRRDTPPSRKLTPPSRKVTPPPRKDTPPARRITPPPSKALPVYHMTSLDSEQPSPYMDSLARRPISPGAATPPVSSSMHSVPFQLSLSEPCITPTQDIDEELCADSTRNVAAPLFYLEESEESEEEVSF
jgi:hypothetical protein